MAQGILNFYDVAKRKDFARDFQFQITSLGPLTEEDLVYCRTASLPTKQINNQQVPYMGLNFNIPGSVSYPGSDGWVVNMWCDEAINVRAKLDAWISEIFSVEKSGGKYGVPAEVATFDLIGKDFKPVRRFELVGIYAATLGTMQYDKGGNGKAQSFDSTFAYQYYRIVG